MFNLGDRIKGFFSSPGNFGFRYSKFPNPTLLNTSKETNFQSFERPDSQKCIQPSLCPRLSEEQVHSAIMEACEEALSEYGDIIDALAKC